MSHMTLWRPQHLEGMRRHNVPQRSTMFVRFFSPMSGHFPRRRKRLYNFCSQVPGASSQLSNGKQCLLENHTLHCLECQSFPPTTSVSPIFVLSSGGNSQRGNITKIGSRREHFAHRTPVLKKWNTHCITVHMCAVLSRLLMIALTWICSDIYTPN